MNEYELATDHFGNRYWICRYPDGEVQPCPSGVDLTFYCNPRDLSGTWIELPIGTRITLQTPAPKEEPAL